MSSPNKWIGIAEETTYGVKVSTPTKSLTYGTLDLNPDQGLLEVEESEREISTMVTGPFVGSGSLGLYARPDTIGHFLKWAMGAVTSAQQGGTAVYKHTFTMAETIKSFTLSDNERLSNLDSRFLAGCLIKKLTLEAPARELVTCDLDLLYAWEDLATKPTKGTISVLRPFVFHDLTILKLATTDFKAESFSINIENDIADDVHDLGSRKITDIVLSGSNIAGEFEMKFKDWTQRKIFYGATNATEPQEDVTPQQLEIELTGEATGVTGYPNYKLHIVLPKTLITENPAPASKRERLKQTFSFRAVKDTGTIIELLNKDTSY
jgi:hypothetical protein